MHTHVPRTDLDLPSRLLHELGDTHISTRKLVILNIVVIKRNTFQIIVARIQSIVIPSSLHCGYTTRFMSLSRVLNYVGARTVGAIQSIKSHICDENDQIYEAPMHAHERLLLGAFRVKVYCKPNCDRQRHEQKRLRFLDA